LKRHITYNGTRLAECQKLQGELEKKNVLLEENIRKEISKFEKAQLRKQSYKEKMVLLERNLTRVSNEGGDSLTKEENKQLKKKKSLATFAKRKKNQLFSLDVVTCFVRAAFKRELRIDQENVQHAENNFQKRK